MKFLVVFALFAAVASAFVLPAGLNLTPSQVAEVEQIMAAIYSPSTDPTTAVMLEQMLYELLGVTPVQPPINVPAIIDDFDTPHLQPEIIDFPLPDGALAPVVVEPVAQAPSSSPLVQIIVNVQQQGDSVSVSPVQIDQEPTPVIVVEEAEESIIKPTPVIIVEEAEESIIKPTPVIVVEQPEVQPEPVIVAPIVVAPAVIAPETLN